MKSVNFEEAGKFLTDIPRAIVISHVNPDIDAYGSMCGLGIALQKMGKEVLLLNESPRVEHLCFIAGTDQIVSSLSDDWSDAPAVICDCGDKKRVGDVLRDVVFNGKRTCLNIDHHVSNDFFADLNVVYPHASSTCEIVYEILSAMSVEIVPEIALCLFAGISGDTGSFQYTSTSARTFEVATELVKCGAKPYDVYLNLYGSTPLRVFQLQAHALNQLKLHFAGRVAEVFIDQDTFESFGVTDAELDKIQESALKIKGVLISCFIRHDGGIWKVSLRAKGEQLDVSRIAESFGGGGHRAAAAFRTRSEVSTFRDSLLKQCEAALGVL